MRVWILGAMLVVLVGMTGCTKYVATGRTGADYWRGDLVTNSYRIAETLQQNLRQPLGPEDTIIVASFVNVDNLQQSSTFGRIIAEQVGSRFAQKGYKVLELTLRKNSIFMSERKGEFLLSRDLRQVSRDHNAAAVIVGVYGEGYDTVYVSSRIVRPADNIILASCDLGIPMSFRAMEQMLGEPE